MRDCFKKIKNSVLKTPDPWHDRQRAEQAREVIDHPLFLESFEQLIEVYLKRWIDSGGSDGPLRESLWQCIKLLFTVKNHFEIMIKTGDFAEVKIDELKQFKN